MLKQQFHHSLSIYGTPIHGCDHVMIISCKSHQHINHRNSQNISTEFMGCMPMSSWEDFTSINKQILWLEQLGKKGSVVVWIFFWLSKTALGYHFRLVLVCISYLRTYIMCIYIYIAPRMPVPIRPFLFAWVTMKSLMYGNLKWKKQ